MKTRCTFCWTLLASFPTHWSTINGVCCPLCYKAYYEPRPLPIRWLKEPTDTEPGMIEFIGSEAEKAIEDSQREVQRHLRQEAALAHMTEEELIELARGSTVDVQIRVLKLTHISAHVAMEIFGRGIGGSQLYVMAEEFLSNPVAPLLLLERPELADVLKRFQSFDKTLYARIPP